MDELAQLLDRWLHGDAAVVGRIAEVVLPTVRQFASARLGPALRQKLDSEDLAQDAILEFLDYGPRFVPQAPGQLCELLFCIVRNALHDHDRWFKTARRAMAREQPIDGVDPAAGSSAGPVHQAAARETTDRMRLALELLPADGRRVLLLHMRDGASFGEIGAGLGVSAEAARSLYRRTRADLLQRMTLLQAGDFDGALDGPAGPAGPDGPEI
jgi:RNA polymerase sigma factor (sigma-70 family)